MTYAADFVRLCMAQRGDRYVFGSEASFSDPDPDVFDCSELVEWALHRLGISYPDGTWNQYAFSKRAGLAIPIDRAIRTPGALLFQGYQASQHVAVSRGDHTTIEARGRAYGVNTFGADGRPWSVAALVPGLNYGAPPPGPVKPAPKPPTAKAPVFSHHGGTAPIRANHYDCELVKVWQGRMKGRGWRITVDGDYGPASAETARQFQRDKGLTVDGILGPKTFAAAWTSPVT